MSICRPAVGSCVIPNSRYIVTSGRAPKFKRESRRAEALPQNYTREALRELSTEGEKWVYGISCIKKILKLLAIRLTALMVPGPGIEPGWIAPTVFETVASTDSAIRADGGGIARGKVTKFFLFIARGGNYFTWGISGGGFTGDSGDSRWHGGFPAMLAGSGKPLL